MLFKKNRPDVDKMKVETADFPKGSRRFRMHCHRFVILFFNSLHRMLVGLGYRPSRVGVRNFYLTRRPDIDRFFEEIKPANQKHTRRYQEFISVGM